MTYFAKGAPLLVSGVLFCSSVLAADMTFHGTLVEPPPCTISNNETIEVNFGNSIGVNTVDGVAHRQQVDYHLNCDVGASLDGLALQLSTASPAAFDSAAVQSSLNGLGLRMLWDGEPADFGKMIPVDPASMPVLEAVPVKAPDMALTEGAFEAYVTLQAVYQ